MDEKKSDIARDFLAPMASGTIAGVASHAFLSNRGIADRYPLAAGVIPVAVNLATGVATYALMHPSQGHTVSNPTHEGKVSSQERSKG